MRPEPSPGQHTASSIRDAEDIVLARLKITEGVPVETLSRFGDDVWDLSPAIFHVPVRPVQGKVDFTGIDCPVERLTAKEYIFAWLNERIADPAGRLQPLQARTALTMLRQFMAFMHGRQGRFAPALIDQPLLDDWLAFQTNRPILPTQVAASLRPAFQLHRLARFLTHGGLSFLPWNGRAAFAVAGCRGCPSENRTPRIPEPVIGALLRWSLRYVDDFAPDILAGRVELDGLEAAAATGKRAPRVPSLAARVALWTEDRRRAGRGIPVWSVPEQMGGICGIKARVRNPDGPVLNMQLIASRISAHPISLVQNKVAYRMLHDALNDLGPELGGMDTAISVLPETGLPWRGRFDVHTLAHEERQLQTAAYILCAYLTGMRDGEVQAMRPGSLLRSRSANGLTERLAIRSLVYKGRKPEGEQADWVTIAPAARAILVAERLAARHRSGEDNGGGIWTVLHRATAKDRGLPHVVRRINEYRDHLDRQFGAADTPVIPQVGGRAWVFNTRQFRRTVAWHIANRPFGVIAGKIQYKHASVAMFDGYAGASASGFRQEVEAERHLGQLDDIVVHYETRLRGEPLGGPAAARIAAEFERVAQQMGPMPGMLADSKRVKAMLGHLARSLHVGILNDCFFERTSALCLATSKDPSDQPRLSACAPDRCPNSCIARSHLPAWEGAIARAEDVLGDKRLSKLQRDVIRQDRDRMRKLISPLLQDPS
jgi:integrase